MNPILSVVLRSLWVLPVLAGPDFAFLVLLGFIAAWVQIGAREPRSWRHAVMGVVYLIVGLVAQGAFGNLPGVAALLIHTGVWLAAIVHALVIYPRALGATPAASLAPARAAAPAREPAPVRRRRAEPVPQEARELADTAASTRSRLLADDPPAPEPVADPIDVNTASRAQLRRLLRVDRKAADALLTERTRRGGFASLDDFARAAGLQPHELARLRREAVCSPRPRAPRRFGRRVDL